MSWLKRKLRSWILDEDIREEVRSTRPSRLVSGSDIDSEDCLNITVRKAIGGKIVTFRQYDRKTDRNNHRLYIVPDEMDFDKELGKMITLESMRL